MSQLYKFKREDFGELPLKLNHLDITINFLSDYIEAEITLFMTALKTLATVDLDAKDLEILSVHSGLTTEYLSVKVSEYSYDKDRAKLKVMLPEQISAGGDFVIRARTRCTASDTILEGIYKDDTPPGSPQQYMSQCQQWGFQRIMPIIDDCRAKCTMRTTLEGDIRYSHLISNGNIDRVSNPSGKPVPRSDDPSRQIITFVNNVPMAPYLFLAVAGTWDVLSDEVVYPNGKRVKLEYLVPPGRTKDAEVPMEILKESVLWVYDRQDYEYPADTYRTICMNKSNFGGMENVGNTTIVTDAALIDEHTLDQSLLYAHAVIVHEFEHNQCGSETTMETPFDVWLNEAYTVQVEREFVSDVFDPDFTRLNQVDSIRNPLLGPLAIEDGGAAGKIVRDGFNDPDELIDGVTYVKAAEVIRMLKLVVGETNFKAGKTLYFSRYHNGNANTDQFFECFEEVSGKSLEQFKRNWLYVLGYPKVFASANYDSDSRHYRLSLRQETPAGTGPFHVPISIALFGKDGGIVPGSERLIELTENSQDVEFNGLSSPPAFASVNRDYSFYGTLTLENSPSEELVHQVRLDTNQFNRVEAMRRLTDTERVGLLLNTAHAVSPTWLELYGDILRDYSFSPALKAYFLRIEEQPMDRRYAVWYPELVRAREGLMAAVNETYRDDLVECFHRTNTYVKPRSPKDGIQERILKNAVLELISCDDTADSHDMIFNHFKESVTIQDRVSALVMLNRSSSPKRHEILNNIYEQWHDHLSAYANYLRIIASGTCSDVFDMIRYEKDRPSFDPRQPTWCRALFLPMAANNKKLWTVQGLEWLERTVIELSTINHITAGRLLNALQHYKNLKPELQSMVKPVLERIEEKVSADINPALHGQASAYLGR